MTYDAKVPHSLKREQQWFGSIIGRPIDEDSKMNPISPTGQPMETEAAEHILPSPTLRPAQRIQIYNQQYWWRLLSTLHESFPLVTRLFGYFDFNRTIAIPFLTKYPPNTWSLNTLGDKLPRWVQDAYHETDKELVLNAVKLDWAFIETFLAVQLPALNNADLPANGDMNAILSRPLYLQPHVMLFTMPYDLFSYRDAFMKQSPDYWVENDFPELERGRGYNYLLYRNRKGDISWKEVALGELKLLNMFRKGSTIEQACEWLEEQDSALCEEAINNLHLWFQEWTMRGWLSLQNPTTYPRPTE